MAHHMILFRRHFLGTAVTAGMGSILNIHARPAQAQTTFNPFDANTTVAIGGRGPTIVEAACESNIHDGGRFRTKRALFSEGMTRRAGHPERSTGIGE